MKKLFLPLHNQNGSMILIALLLLVVLTIMGITSTSTSVIENQIAVNEQLHKTAFYHSDSGIYTTAKLIGWTIDEGDTITFDDDLIVEYNGRYLEGKDFYDQITDLDDEGYDAGIADIQYELENGVVRADIQFIGTSASGLPEGGVVFGEGATSHAGGQEISVYFRIFSEGSAQRNSLATLAAGYQKVLGVSGGL